MLGGTHEPKTLKEIEEEVAVSIVRDAHSNPRAYGTFSGDTNSRIGLRHVVLGFGLLIFIVLAFKMVF